MDNNCGVIYILTNPSFKEYVKIGYATDINRRLAELNRTTCTPYAFRVYATYAVPTKLSDKKIHIVIDKLNPKLRSREEVDGKMRVREFYAMSPEDAYSIFEAMAEIHGTQKNLVKYSLNKEEQEDEALAEEIRVEHAEKKENFSFYRCGIKKGEEIVFLEDPTIKCIVHDDRNIEYNGEVISMSKLARDLLQKNYPVQGTIHFTYNGEILSALRTRLEAENKY